MAMFEWFKRILQRLYLLDPPVAKRSKKDRRHTERRWKGSEGDKPIAKSDPRRKKERRKAGRRG
jgi:hypothetical protein